MASASSEVPPPQSRTNSVLFVCLGNICRSPIAEAVFRHLCRERGLPESRWRVDSAGTSGWNDGRKPDERGRALMSKMNIPMNHRARQVTDEDFDTFDFILAMDEENVENLKGMRPRSSSSNDGDGKDSSKLWVGLLGEFDPERVRIIEDPYYGGDEGFVTVYQQCLRCCNAFLDRNG